MCSVNHEYFARPGYLIDPRVESIAPSALFTRMLAHHAEVGLTGEQIVALLDVARELTCREMVKLVTDYLPDTPCVARAYCPGCEPDADPSLEILDVRWCESHSPTRDGADDEVVTASAYLSGSAEAGGDDNRRWCDILHGRR